SLRYKIGINQTQKDIESALNDDNDTTCIDVKTERLYVILPLLYSISWIRFVTPYP
ncbi:hypothetical protein BgiMline_014377, partial [Biomphalaria glabrata]